MWTRFSILLAIGLLAGCSNRLNTDCEWPAEPSRSLSLQDNPDARHLLRDVELAEELSIRFGDKRWSPGPSRARGRVDQCFLPLLQQIADRHSVALQDVFAARERLADRGLNLAINVPAAAFFAMVTAFALRRIRNRFSVSEEPIAVLGATAFCSVLIGGVTVGFGRVWEAVFETIRLGNGHLSYRGLRLPWTQHSLELAILASVAFVVVSIGYFSLRQVRSHRLAVQRWRRCHR